MPNSIKKIYYKDSGYNIDRNLVNVPLRGYVPTKKIGASKVISHIHYKLLGGSSFLGNSHWELLKNTNKLWHFWNGVSFGKTPWVSSFETTLPRWHTENKMLQKIGVKALASDACKKLIAISECTKNLQKNYLEESFDSLKSNIMGKTTVIHPPQKTIIDSYSEKNLPPDKLVFTLIGSAFFRKGGKEVLHVFDHLLRKNMPVELNIISSLSYGDYASKATKKDLTEAESIINKHPDTINHYNRLPNGKVLSLLKNSHIGLLPTYGDTYGYSVLEGQACGCPMITTNIRALPEINDNNYGWIIDVPKATNGKGKINTAEERTKFSTIIQEGLKKIINDIVTNPNQISKKGQLSLSRIKENHEPEDVGRKLEQIYDEALS